MHHRENACMQTQTQKPIQRSALRLRLGSGWFTLLRYSRWYLGGLRFARQRPGAFPCRVFTHQTPLLRKLKDVDMALQHNKVVNLRLAVPRVNGVVLLPGETFSYWKCIGRPTRRKGYLKGMVLQNGGFHAGTGGGLCQLSNLIYWLTVHTPLSVVERHRHGYDVFPDAGRTQPFGSGATCFYNYGDLMIRNDTAQPFRLEVEVTATHLRGAWAAQQQPEYRYEVYEKEHRMQLEAWGGYTRHNLLCRRRYRQDGAPAGEEFVVENHAVMIYQPYLTAGRE